MAWGVVCYRDRDKAPRETFLKFAFFFTEKEKLLGGDWLNNPGSTKNRRGGGVIISSTPVGGTDDLMQAAPTS